MNDFNPFTFSGRIGRLQYFGFSVIWVILLGLAGGVIAVIAGPTESSDMGTGASVATGLLYIPYAIGTLSYAVRRFHDFDKSGRWILLSFVPLVNLVVGLVLLFAPGTNGANRFGERS